MHARRTAQEFLRQHELPDDWRVLVDRIEVTFVAASFRAGAEFVGVIARLADEADHHPDVDLRYPGAVHICLVTHASGGLTRLDAQVATAISAAAVEAGLRSEPTTAIRVGVELPGGDPGQRAGFWTALLGYRSVPPVDAAGRHRALDSRRISPPLSFVVDTAEHGGAPRLTVDLAADVAEERVAAALAAGGMLLEDRSAGADGSDRSDGAVPASWLLADPSGVEVAIGTVVTPAG